MSKLDGVGFDFATYNPELPYLEQMRTHNDRLKRAIEELPYWLSRVRSEVLKRQYQTPKNFGHKGDQL